MHHLRNGDQPEFSEFSQESEGNHLNLHFTTENNNSDRALFIRQYNVRNPWHVIINDQKIGELVNDEKDMISCLDIPSETLKNGENSLRIEPGSDFLNDIRVGQIKLEDGPKSKVLNEGTLELEVIDGEEGSLMPARLTITGKNGILKTVGKTSGNQLTKRPGYVYTGNGKATMGLPAGKYTIYANRGIEYGMDSMHLEVQPGDHFKKELTLKKEVSTEGWISSDTHIHTVTYSGHGDATARERVITLAGEGLELPIITDHNIKVNLDSLTTAMNLNSWYTPVVGYEYTTDIGHFNVFPAAPGPVPNHKIKNWAEAAANIPGDKKDRAIVLNHARDIHAGFRPFDPKRHISIAGQNLDGWTQPANAMEVINSGATQTDWMQLFRDWFGMLNRGYFLTPAGSSDSHDVSRYFVGQGRTYIKSDNTRPGNINIDRALDSFLSGKVMVSFGMLAEMKVNNYYGPGTMVPGPQEELVVDVKVKGPSWTRADKVTLYANGKKIREESINDPGEANVKWSGSWTIENPGHDMFLVAIAEGPGTGMPYWPVHKPYQPDGPEWTPRIFGSSGAIWVDNDGNGRPTSAYAYARQLWEESQGNEKGFLKNLENYDRAVAVQAASILMEEGINLTTDDFKNSLNRANPAVQNGFNEYYNAYNLSQQ